jgi:broad specificity phosphatase PhoE
MPARRLALSLFVAAFLAAATAPAQPPVPAAPAATTTVIVVRHAEKATDDPRDPSLSAAGEARAQALAAALADAGVAAVYSTELKRTWLTADPLAKKAGLTVEKRPMAGGGDVPAYARELAREVLARHAGKTVLIVGHSNTVPEIVKALSGDPVAAIEDSEYDNLFLVTAAAPGEGSVVRARYGAPSR